MTSGKRSPRYQSGFGYLMVLFALAAIGLTGAGAGQIWHTSVQRDKEADLLFAGNAYREAIASYYNNASGPVKQYPRSLQDLLEDRRSVVTKRHLRKLYFDPMTSDTEWGLVMAGDRITGVHSNSQAAPLLTQHKGKDQNFNGAKHYSEWVFLASDALP
jgi:type II secretory pathway pseudopilin PulG